MKMIGDSQRSLSNNGYIACSQQNLQLQKCKEREENGQLVGFISTDYYFLYTLASLSYLIEHEIFKKNIYLNCIV